MIDVADGTDVDVRLAALKGRGVGPGRVDECLSPQGGLKRVDRRLLAQSARGGSESPDKRHVEEEDNERREGGRSGRRRDGVGEIVQ